MKKMSSCFCFGIKINSLTDKVLIDKLVEASKGMDNFS